MPVLAVRSLYQFCLYPCQWRVNASASAYLLSVHFQVTPACVFDELQSAGQAILTKWMEDGAELISWLAVSERTFFALPEEAAAQLLVNNWGKVLWLHSETGTFISLSDFSFELNLCKLMG